MAQQTHDEWKEVRNIHREYSFFYQMGGGLLLMVVGVLIGAAMFGTDKDYLQELFMQALGVIITVLVLDKLAERRDERRAERELKARLVMEVRSQSNETARSAVHELDRHHWLSGDDGILKGVELTFANLQSALMMFANLQKTLLMFANLQNADLTHANLQGANLDGSKLQKANLWAVNLENAHLMGVNLENANLDLANLQGADLINANLQGVKLTSAKFDEKTTLPDYNRWTPKTDMTRFTNPQHPQFWRSDNPDSPAYRGDDKPTSE